MGLHIISQKDVIFRLENNLKDMENRYGYLSLMLYGVLAVGGPVTVPLKLKVPPHADFLFSKNTDGSLTVSIKPEDNPNEKKPATDTPPSSVQEEKPDTQVEKTEEASGSSGSGR